VITLLNLVGVPASALTQLMARQTSRDHASTRHAPSTALLREGNQALLVVGGILAAIVALMSPLLSGFLAVPAGLILAAAAGIPFTVALPLLLGEFQGSQRFIAYSSVFAGYAALKLAAAVALGAACGSFGVVAGLSLGAALAYFIALRMVHRKLAIKPRWPWLRPAIAYLAFLLPGTMAIAVLLSVDVVLVKHFFAARLAGEYAAVAALGRAIFWGASGVGAVLFPKIIFQETRRENGSHLVFGSLALVIMGGLFALMLLAFSAPHVLAIFAGAGYTGGAEYLAGYALGMTLLGAAVVLIAIHQSRGKPAFLAIVIPITVLEPLLIMSFHTSLSQVVLVMDACMGLLVAGLAVLALVEERNAGRISLPALSTDSLRSSAAPQVQAAQVQL